MDGAPGQPGLAGEKGQRGESGTAGEGYQFLSKEEVTARGYTLPEDDVLVLKGEPGDTGANVA